MKRFIVEVDDSCNSASVREIEELLTCDNACRYHKKYVTVTELPALPEVKKVETGVLKKHIQELIVMMHPEACCDVKRRVLVVDNVRDLFEDISTKWDFDSIPVGATIEIVYSNNRKTVLYFKGINKDKRPTFSTYFNDDNNFTDLAIEQTIKSIRIVELAREGGK